MTGKQVRTVMRAAEDRALLLEMAREAHRRGLTDLAARLEETARQVTAIAARAAAGEGPN